jgi:hypothetical protein
MPTWENATSKKVEVWEVPESHEMNHLNQNGRDTAEPMLPQVARQPSPGRPSPPSPYDSFAGSNAGLQSRYTDGGQSTGVVGRKSPSAYRGVSTSPRPGGGYGAGYGDQQNSYQGASSSPSPGGGYGAGYGAQQNPPRYGGASSSSGPGGGYGAGYGGQQYARNNGYNNDAPRSPVSPVYAPSGSTAYDPSRYTSPSNAPWNPPQQQPNSYGGQGVGRDVTRKAPPGSWKDV